MTPLPWISALVILAALAGRTGWALPCALAAALLCALALWRNAYVPPGTALSAAALTAGLALGATVPSPVPRLRAISQGGLLSAEVVEGCRARDVGAFCRVVDARGTRVDLTVEHGCPARPGDRIEAVATFESLAPVSNGARAGPGISALRRGTTETARASACEVLPRTPGPLASVRRAGMTVRDALERGMRATGEPTAGRARALLFGDTGVLDEVSQDEFRQSGLSHLLAVSGAHVALLAGILGAIVRGLLRRIAFVAARGRVELFAALVTLPALAVFVAATGESPSSLRALCGCALGIACRLAGRAPRGEAIVAASALVMVVGAPANVLDVGWQLSVTAAWALSAAPRDEPRARDERSPTLFASLRAFFADALLATLRVAVATAPLLAWHFQRVPLAALLANAIAAPLAETLALPAVLFVSALGAISPRAGGISSVPLARLLDALFALPRAALALPAAVLDAPTPTPAQAVCLVAIALLGIRAKRWRSRIQLALVATALVAGLEILHTRAAQPRGVLRVTALDVGQGDAILVDLPDGAAMLVDAGGSNGGGWDPGERVVVPFLADRRRRALAAVVASHPHPDHIGGLPAVLRWVEVAALWDTFQGERLPPATAYAALRREAAQRLVPVLGPAALCGPPREFHGALLTVLAPCPGADEQVPPNDASFVLRLDYGRASVLLPGDLERGGEARLLSALAPVTLLKLGHHGSRTSSSAPWLDRLRPRVGLYSAGHPSRFLHPHAETLREFSERNIPLFGTDTSGAVSVTLHTDGSYRVTSGASLDDAP